MDASDYSTGSVNLSGPRTERDESDPASHSCAAASGARTEGAAQDSETETEAAAWAQSKSLAVLELRADEVIEVARAASNIRSICELNRHRMTIQDRELCTRRAVKTLEQICCDPRLIVALMLFAADHPDWAWVNFWHAFCPEMTLRQMGHERRINVSTVKYWLNHVELPADAYDFIPEDR